MCYRSGTTQSSALRPSYKLCGKPSPPPWSSGLDRLRGGGSVIRCPSTSNRTRRTARCTRAWCNPPPLQRSVHAAVKGGGGPARSAGAPQHSEYRRAVCLQRASHRLRGSSSSSPCARRHPPTWKRQLTLSVLPVACCMVTCSRGTQGRYPAVLQGKG